MASGPRKEYGTKVGAMTAAKWRELYHETLAELQKAREELATLRAQVYR